MKVINIIIIITICVIGLPTAVQAAQVSFEPKMISTPQAAPYTVTFLLNTEKDSLNTIEGVVTVDDKVGEVMSVTDSGSIVTYWVERPQWNPENRTITFSGAIPGGYTGAAGILFSVVLPSYEGAQVPSALLATNVKALRNDGLGSSAKVSSQSFSIGSTSTVADAAITEQLYIDERKPDNIPPEVFSPQLSQDPRLFDGRWFINFATTDKQSGIDRYEIQETRSGKLYASGWKRAESPYVLEDQELHSFIYVIAIDRQGNERMIKVFPRKPLAWYNQYQWPALGAGIILLVGAGYLIARRYNRKQQNHA